MPIQLTTAMKAGDIDPVGVYDHVRIVRQTHDSVRLAMFLDLEYGTVVDSNWVSCPASPIYGSLYPPNVQIDGSAYTDLLTTHVSNVDELTYDAVKRGLYEWMQAQYASLAGTIV